MNRSIGKNPLQKSGDALGFTRVMPTIGVIFQREEEGRRERERREGEREEGGIKRGLRDKRERKGGGERHTRTYKQKYEHLHAEVESARACRRDRERTPYVIAAFSPRFVPYEEDFADELEEHFRQAMTTGVWHQRLEFPSGEIIVMHSPHAMVHFMPNR